MDRQKFLDLINPAILMVVKKGEDYNQDLQIASYFPHGNLSYHQMLHLKTLRLQSLVTKKDTPNFDSIEDCLYDLLNYTVFWLDYLKNKNSNMA